MKITITRKSNLPTLSLTPPEGLELEPGGSVELTVVSGDLEDMLVEAFMRGVRIPNTHTQSRRAAVKEAQRILNG